MTSLMIGDQKNVDWPNILGKNVDDSSRFLLNFFGHHCFERFAMESQFHYASLAFQGFLENYPFLVTRLQRP